ncbi:hypothetical protein OAJ57_02935 [Alphaproteobacteria bacterium]|nr:hypothetical protein [Alphaproteobacteria bacterium]
MAKVYELTVTKITVEEVTADARSITLTVPTNMKSGEIYKALQQLQMRVLKG